MDGSFARLGAAPGRRWSGRFIAPACAAKLIVAAGGYRFPEAKTPGRGSRPRLDRYGAATATTAAAAGNALDRLAGMIKKAVYRLSGRRVRGEDDKIRAIKTVASDLPLDVYSMGIPVDPWTAPTCALPNGLRMHPASARTSGAHVSRSDVPSYEGLGPCPRPRIATRARKCRTDFYTTHAAGSRIAPRSQYSDKWYPGFSETEKERKRNEFLAAAPNGRVGSKSKHSHVTYPSTACPSTS